MTPKNIAESIVGAVDWQSENHGLCKCPGESAHTSHTRVRDTTVFIDGAPTIFCWHSSCTPYRDEANRKLRRAISSDPLYRSTVKDSLMVQGSSSILRALVIQKDPESEVLDRIKTIAESNKQRYLTHYNWDPADMFEESPIPIPDEPQAQYEAMLSLFKPDDIVWIGGVKDSGNHPQHFKTAREWMQTPPISQFTTAGVFATGTISRANENVISRRYLVIESDVLTKPQMGAVFQLMRDVFRMKLRAIVDTGGKSLHGWFDIPSNAGVVDQLKAFLVPIGCDPATFKPSQPVRMPGVKRNNDNMQSLLWFCQGGKMRELPMIEPAVALGIKPKTDEWPPIKRYDELMVEKLPEPEILIAGILHQGGKLLLGGGSKSFKSWALIDLALSIQVGGLWWGQQCKRAKVLFINFEIQEWSFRNRLADVVKAKNLTQDQVADFDVWTLRGYAADLTTIRPIIEKQIEGKGYQAIILDPNYMLMGDRDENSAGDMASLMNEFEVLAVRHNLSVILSHHFGKGNKSGSESIDRFSGSGVFARNPDSLVVLTAHEEDERSFTCEVTLRNFPPLDSFVVQWHYPLFLTNYCLNPDNLKKAGAHKAINDSDLLKAMGSKAWVANDLVKNIAQKMEVSDRTVYRYIKRLTNAGKILIDNGLYSANQASF